MTKSPKKTSNPYKQTDWKKQLSAAAMPDLNEIDKTKKKMNWSNKGGSSGRRQVSGTRGLGFGGSVLGRPTPLPRKEKRRSVRRRRRR
jgi:hypothetical protein